MSLAIVALFSGSALAAPALTLSGDCPGPVTIDVAGATPGGDIVIVAGSGPGAEVIPHGPCTGTALGLAGPLKAFGPLRDVDGDGAMSMSPVVGDHVCDRSMVVVDVSSCTVSPLATFGDDGGGGAAVPGEFNAPLPGTLGGQRVFAPDGTLWYLTYGGYLASTPPGGGVSTLHVHDSEVGAHGYGGTPFVEDDGTVLWETGGSGVARFDPGSGTWATIADTPFNYYGVSQLFRDVDGNIVTGRPGLVIRPDDSQVGVDFLRDYVVNTHDWVYTMESTTVYRQRHDGSERSVWGTGCVDGYGMALGLDGSLYCSQGNTEPASVHRIPPEGGAATVLGTVPAKVLFVATHPVTGNIYLAGFGAAGDDVYEMDPVTGDSVLYGDAP
ncbi:MAG: hypothetical protein ACI8PZ_004769 [Myxococcota bacterium]|jgi:hypothetical protein